MSIVFFHLPKVKEFVTDIQDWMTAEANSLPAVSVSLAPILAVTISISHGFQPLTLQILYLSISTGRPKFGPEKILWIQYHIELSSQRFFCHFPLKLVSTVRNHCFPLKAMKNCRPCFETGVFRIFCPLQFAEHQSVEPCCVS